MSKSLVINSCSNENFWYSELVGFPELAQFEIIDETEEDYIIEMSNEFNNLTLAVLKTDCLVILK